MSDINVPPESVAGAHEAPPAAIRAARIDNAIGLLLPVVGNLGMRRTAPAELRWFGVGASVVLLAAAFLSWRAGWAGTAAGLVAAHLALVLAGLVHPRFPEIPGRLWIRFGETLGRVMAYPIFALLYFVAVTPTALLVRILGKDPLERNAPDRASYWRPRKPSPKERFERQF